MVAGKDFEPPVWATRPRLRRGSLRMGCIVAKYRTRTKIRQHLPFVLIGLLPKGKKDCGDHEWYRSADDIYLCYHCVVGIRHGRPDSWKSVTPEWR
jgi:hypothetical protein